MTRLVVKIQPARYVIMFFDSAGRLLHAIPTHASLRKLEAVDTVEVARILSKLATRGQTDEVDDPEKLVNAAYGVLSSNLPWEEKTRQLVEIVRALRRERR